LKRKPPTINGDGKQTRDYVYVGDVVEANLLALKSPYTGPLNIGTGRETDVLTLFQMLRKKLGSEVNAVHGPAKTGEQKRSLLDIRAARKAFGWAPRVSIDQGLDWTLDHYRRASRTWP
jgi:UDP-glucose 4-epimerase